MCVRDKGRPLKWFICMAALKGFNLPHCVHTTLVTLVLGKHGWSRQALSNTFSQGSYSFTTWVFVGVKFSHRQSDTGPQ
jgi:hypothetical protein